MATYTVINGTESTLTAVDGTNNVDPMSYKDGLTLTTTQLTTLLDGSTFGKAIAVTTDESAITWKDRLKRAVALAGLYVSA